MLAAEPLVPESAPAFCGVAVFPSGRRRILDRGGASFAGAALGRQSRWKPAVTPSRCGSAHAAFSGNLGAGPCACGAHHGRILPAGSTTVSGQRAVEAFGTAAGTATCSGAFARPGAA